MEEFPAAWYALDSWIDSKLLHYYIYKIKHSNANSMACMGDLTAYEKNIK